MEVALHLSSLCIFEHGRYHRITLSLLFSEIGDIMTSELLRLPLILRI